MAGVLIKWGDLDTEAHTGRTPCEEEGRDQGDASAGQGTPKTASRTPEAGREAWNGFSSQPSGATPGSGTSGLQDCGTVHFCLSHPAGGYL